MTTRDAEGSTSIVDRSVLVRTAWGPARMDPENGYCLPHEHVISDLRAWWDGAGDGRTMDVSDPVTSIANVDPLRRRPHGISRENMVLADWVVAAKELGMAAGGGCQLVVDLTGTGLDPMPSVARRAADAAGLALVIAAGHYLDDAVEESIRGASVDKLLARLLRQVDDGVDGCMVGIIGEIGTSANVTDFERRSLTAAALAQQATGLPVNVHLHPYARRAHEVLDVLSSAGADLTKIALSHCDGEMDLDWLTSMLDRGPYVEFDLFGTGPEWTIAGRGFASDSQRVRMITLLCERGWSSRLLLSHDICTRNALHRFGGWGYDHLQEHIFPLLDDAVGVDVRARLTQRNPLDFLATVQP